MNRTIDAEARDAEIRQPVNRTAPRVHPLRRPAGERAGSELARARSEPGEVEQSAGSCLVSRSKKNGWLPMNLLSGRVLAVLSAYWVSSSANGARALSPAQRAGLTIEPFVPRPEGTQFRNGSPQFGIDPFVARITAPPRRHRIEFAERHAWDRISNQTLGRGPTGRWTHDSLVNPARWAGLRDRAPLALGRINGITRNEFPIRMRMKARSPPVHEPADCSTSPGFDPAGRRRGVTRSTAPTNKLLDRRAARLRVDPAPERPRRFRRPIPSPRGR